MSETGHRLQEKPLYFNSYLMNLVFVLRAIVAINQNRERLAFSAIQISHKRQKEVIRSTKEAMPSVMFVILFRGEEKGVPIS